MKSSAAPESAPASGPGRRRASASGTRHVEDLAALLEQGGQAQPEGRIVQIFEVACRLFAQRGFDGVSMRDIAQACGISKATLYHYFPDKDSLLRPLVMGNTKSLYLHVARHDEPGQPAILRLRSFVAETATYFERNRWAWIVSSSTFWNDPEARTRRERVAWRDRYEQLLRDILEAGVASGQFRSVDVPMTGRMILGAVNWMPRWYNPQGALPAADIALRFCDMMVEGIHAPKAKPRSESALRTPRKRP